MKIIVIILSLVLPVSPGAFSWRQAVAPGAGCHQDECVKGQWPMGIAPVKAFDDKLWMVGQKQVWSSPDGITWDAAPKADWEERISFPRIYFKGQMFMFGGMIYQTRTMVNDIWASSDGTTWKKVKEHAEWPARKGHDVIEFNGRLWLFGGATGVDKNLVAKDFINDVWVSEDGLKWQQVTNNAGWPAVDNPRVIVFQNKMWLLGGGGLDHVWNSTDGKTWTRLEEKPEWMPRWDYGLLVYEDRLWVFGGRESDPHNAYNDVWHSTDGVHWFNQGNAPWTPRSGGHSVVFRDRLWLYAGKHTGSVHNWNKDIWMMGKRL